MIVDNSPVSGFLAGLEEKYAPKSDTFDVVLEKGDVLVFRHHADSDELNTLRINAQKFAASMLNESCAPEWIPYLSKDQGVLVYSYHMAALCVKTKQLVTKVVDNVEVTEYIDHPPMAEMEFMRAAKTMPDLFSSVRKALDEVIAVAVFVREKSEFEEIKKD